MPSLDALSQAAGLSRFHFHRVFKAVTGVTPKAYADAHRGKRVRAKLARCRSISRKTTCRRADVSARWVRSANRFLGGDVRTAARILLGRAA